MDGGRVLVLGGYGTFGRRVCRLLSERGIPVTVAGRDSEAAEDLASTLGPAHRSVAVDLGVEGDVRRAVAGHAVAVNCAGPFPQVGRTLLEACLEGGSHHVDLSDDRGWAAEVRARSADFAAHDLCAAYGCSSLPGLSGALALVAADALLAPVASVDVTLFIGNRNPKGGASVASAVGQIGRPVEAPQGVLHAFRDCALVELPPPFGRRRVHVMDSPEYDLFPELLGAREVRVHVGLELRAASATFGLLSRMPWRPGGRTARVLVAGGRLASGVGVSGGVVHVTVRDDEGQAVVAWIGGPTEGQEMAALPCALIAEALVRDDPAVPRGAHPAWEILGPRPLLEGTAASGFGVHFP